MGYFSNLDIEIQERQAALTSFNPGDLFEGHSDGYEDMYWDYDPKLDILSSGNEDFKVLCPFCPGLHSFTSNVSGVCDKCTTEIVDAGYTVEEALLIEAEACDFK